MFFFKKNEGVLNFFPLDAFIYMEDVSKTSKIIKKTVMNRTRTTQTNTATMTIHATARIKVEDYAVNKNVKVLDGLAEALQQHVAMMKCQPLNEVITWNDNQLECDNTDDVWLNPIDNPDWCFFHDGRDVDSGTTVLTNIPHLTIDFEFEGDEECRFWSLPNHTLFEDGGDGRYYADCGDDYVKAAYLFSEVARLVYGFKGERTFTCREGGKKYDNAMYGRLELNFKLPKDPSIKELIVDKIEGYNEKAMRYKGATPLFFDERTFIVSGENKPHTGRQLLRSDSLRKEFVEVCEYCKVLNTLDMSMSNIAV